MLITPPWVPCKDQTTVYAGKRGGRGSDLRKSVRRELVGNGPGVAGHAGRGCVDLLDEQAEGAGVADGAKGDRAVVQSRLRAVAVWEITTANPVAVPTSATVKWFLPELLPRRRHLAFPAITL